MEKAQYVSLGYTLKITKHIQNKSYVSKYFWKAGNHNLHLQVITKRHTPPSIS